MKTFKLVLTYFVATVLSLSLNSCGDDNDEPNPSSIVGTWISYELVDEDNPNMIYTLFFSKDGSGWMTWSDDNHTKYFKYNVNDGVIYFDASDEWGSDTWKCRYEIQNGKNLTIYGCPWGEEEVNIIHLTRK